MKKVFFTTLLMLNFSIANAQGFDWYKVSKEVSVGKENGYTALISEFKYGGRAEADGHCRQLGHQLGMDIRLADFEEVLQIAAYGNPKPDEMMVQIKLKDGTVKYGIVAWDNKKAIKVDPKNPSNKDTKVLFKLRGSGSGAVLETSLKEMNESDLTVLNYQDQPVKKLSAICVHNKKK